MLEYNQYVDKVAKINVRNSGKRLQISWKENTNLFIVNYIKENVLCQNKLRRPVTEHLIFAQ